jgi:fimbrial chaperone protein
VRVFLFATATVLFMLPPAYAGSFKAVPTKIFLNARAKTAVLRVTNSGNEKVTVQLDTKEWSQDENGKDVYTDTRDIIFFPRMADIKKGEERIIRVGYNGKISGATEKTYRLFVQELPVKKPGEMALKFALKLGIPIFVKPVKEIEDSAIQGAELKEGKVLVKVSNNGNTHFIVNRLSITGLDSSGAEVFAKEIGGWYVLSGITKAYAIDIPGEKCRKASAIKVSVGVKDKRLGARVAVDRARCERPAAPDADKTKRDTGKR